MGYTHFRQLGGIFICIDGAWQLNQVTKIEPLFIFTPSEGVGAIEPTCIYSINRKLCLGRSNFTNFDFGPQTRVVHADFCMGGGLIPPIGVGDR